MLTTAYTKNLTDPRAPGIMTCSDLGAYLGLHETIGTELLNGLNDLSGMNDLSECLDTFSSSSCSSAALKLAAVLSVGTASGSGEVYTAASGAGRAGRLARILEGLGGRSSALIDELGEAGIAHNPAEILRIARDGSGRIVFLETGTSQAGLAHVMEQHGAQFAKAGIAKDKVPDLLIQAATKGSQVGVQGRDRTIYEVVFAGKTRRVAISISDNGYIVGANPR